MISWHYWIALLVGFLLVVYLRRKYLLIMVMECGLYAWFLKSIFPYIRFSFYYTSMKGWKYERGYRLLEPGMIILARDNRKLSTLCIPGEMPHAALCVGKSEDGDDYEVGEMVAKGYTKSFFFDVCHEADRVVILRCKGWGPEYARQVIDRCKSFEGLPYDLQFSFGLASLYCSELVYQADFEHRLQVDTSDLLGLGRHYVAPQDIFEATNVEVVWDSDKETK